MWFDSYFSIPTCYGVTGNSNRETLARFKNAIAFQNTFFRFCGDAVSVLVVRNLPDTMSPRVFQQSLLWYGGVVLFEKDGSLFCLPGAPTGDGWNINGDPGRARTWSRNGSLNEEIVLHIPGGDESYILKIMTTMRELNKGHGVYVWDNQMRFPMIKLIIQYAEAVADTYRTLDTIRAGIKRPFIFVGEESVVPSIRKFLNQRDENLDAIGLIDTGAFDASKVNLLPLDAGSQSLNDCVGLLEWYEQKFREIIGIDSNSNIDKKGENLISGELSINAEYEDLQITKRIDTINEGLDFFNRIYGTNIYVEKRGRIGDDMVDGEGTGDNDADRVSEKDAGSVAERDR